MSQRTKLRSLILLALLVIAVSTSAIADETGRCYSASIHGSIVLPDGSTHDASDPGAGLRLRLCYERELSPVSGLHTVYVDGFPVARFTSDRSSCKAPGRTVQPAYFIFLREKHNLLAFQGYVAVDYDRLVSHDLTGTGRGEGRATSRWQLAALDAKETEEGWLFVAARGR